MRDDGSYDLLYDDGETEAGVSETLIRAVESRPAVEAHSSHVEPSILAVTAATAETSGDVSALEGSVVQANYRGKGKYYPGRIAKALGDDKFDIDYDDGEHESAVPRDRLRFQSEPIPSKAASPRVEPTPLSARGAPLFSAGDKVEGNYRGKGRWYPGSIEAVRDDGSYDLLYDDGETEAGVGGTFLRFKDISRIHSDDTRNRSLLFSELKSTNISSILKSRGIKDAIVPKIVQNDTSSRLEEWEKFKSEIFPLSAVFSSNSFAAIKLLGRGKFAAVYRAQFSLNNELVAVKVAQFVGSKVSAIFSEESGAIDITTELHPPPIVCIEEFRREISALVALTQTSQHENIVAFKGCLSEPLAFVMEHVQGGNLHIFLKEVLFMSFPLVMNIVQFLRYDNIHEMVS